MVIFEPKNLHSTSFIIEGALRNIKKEKELLQTINRVDRIYQPYHQNFPKMNKTLFNILQENKQRQTMLATSVKSTIEAYQFKMPKAFEQIIETQSILNSIQIQNLQQLDVLRRTSLIQNLNYLKACPFDEPCAKEVKEIEEIITEVITNPDSSKIKNNKFRADMSLHLFNTLCSLVFLLYEESLPLKSRMCILSILSLITGINMVYQHSSQDGKDY